MEHNLKVLVVVQSDTVPENLLEVFSRETIHLHHARSGAAALVLTGNSLYDLLVLEEPLADLAIESVLGAVRSFEWASAGAPALVMVAEDSADDLARRLEDYPNRVISKSAGKQEIQRAVSELLGVPVRSNSRMMVNVEVETEAANSLKCFQTQNISESGLLLRGAQALPIGASVKLHFCLPDESDPVQGVAMVVRHSTGNETPGVGLRFVELDRAEILRLRRFVDRTLDEEPPMRSDRPADASQLAGV